MRIQHITYYIGLLCRKHRIERGYTLSEIAVELGYTIQNVCEFEHGRNRNYEILLWYIRHGVTTKEILTLISKWEKLRNG